MSTLGTRFVHLHVHSEYSLLDGSIKVKKLITEAAKRKAGAIALTDHDALHGLVEFYLGCADIPKDLSKKLSKQKQEQQDKIDPSVKAEEVKLPALKPILGYEANVPWFSAGLPAGNGHLVLLAESNQGYSNLIQICTYANTEGRALGGEDGTAVSWDVIKKHAAGLICLTACLKSELALLTKADRGADALAFLTHLKEVFGAGNVFVELIDNGLPEQAALRPKLVALAGGADLPLVATGDVHYLKPKDLEIHLSVLAIKHKLQRTDLADVDTSVKFHLATEEEMLERYADLPEALANTVRIAERCNVVIDTKAVFMPDFRQRPDEPADDCLVRLSREGLTARKETVRAVWGAAFEGRWPEYESRLEYELGVIGKMQFAGYFLIVQDFINWAKDKGIPVGPGRGSAAGSLVTYALRITDIDPIRFQLLFERFLNPERISMPDIDTDFCQDRRPEVLDYVVQKYGARAVTQIVTFNRMMAKAALKNLARISGWGFTESNDFAKLVPEKPGITLEQALEAEPRIKERLEADDRARELWNKSLEVEGTLSALGIHAAGVIISDKALDERCPLIESDGQLLTQYEHKYAEKVGLIKFDFLGLKTLTVIEKAVHLIRAARQPDFDIEHIDLEDPKVYAMLSTAHVTGVFQLESAGMRKLLADLKPTCFMDIVAVLALFRPGPLGSGMVEDFVLRKHGKNKVEYMFPQLEPILADTYGVIVYQEQVQKIAAELAGYSLGEADLLRRAMGKKDKIEMEKQKQRFVSGAADNGFDGTKASELFDLMAKFAEYGFNKSHTAAYGWVTYQTAYLKTYYPAEFMTAIMSCDLDNTDKIVTYVRDCLRMKIKLEPPSVNESGYEFSIPAERCIRFGMGAVKGLGQGVIDLIVSERAKNGPYRSVPEFLARTDPRKINKKTLESLIKSGALDGIAANRAELLANADQWLRAISKEMERQETQGDGLFGFEEAPAGAGACGMSEEVRARLIGVQTKATPPWPDHLKLEHELATLGFYVTGHPADAYRSDLLELDCVPLNEVILRMEPAEVPDFKRKVTNVGGVIVSAYERTNKDGARYLAFTIEDGLGELQVTLFARQYASLTTKFEAGDVVWAEVKLRPGIEEGSVQAVCQALGRLEEKRAERVRRIVLATNEDFFREDRDLRALTEILQRFPGKVPVTLEAKMPARKMRLRATLPRFAVNPSDAFLRAVDDAWPSKLVRVERRYQAEIVKP